MKSPPDFARNADLKAPAIAIPEPSQEAVTTWLAGLPLANSEFCFEAVIATLKAFNAHTGLSAGTRFDLAELLRPCVDFLAQRSEAHFIDANLPYGRKAAEYSDWGPRLHAELGRAYAFAAFEGGPSDSAADHESYRLAAISRGLQQYGLLLLRKAQSYRPPTDDFWAEVYQLYEFAESRELLNDRFDDEREPESCRTPLGQFKRILLFALANTHRLRQREMAQVFEMISRLADYAHLRTEADWEGMTPEYCVDLDEHGPPVRGLAASEIHAAALRFLYTRRLARTIIGLAQAASGLSGIPAYSKGTAIRLARSLGAVDRRKWNRQPEDGSCNLVLGLSDLISVLSTPEPAGKPEARIEASGFELLSLDWTTANFDLEPGQDFQLSGDASESRAFRNESFMSKAFADARVFGALPDPSIWGNSSSAQKELRTVDGRLINAGPQGYCIARGNDRVAWARVGEIVGLWTDRVPWHIGVIRWLGNVGDREFLVGLELLAPTAEVVEVRDPASAFSVRGLLLSVDAVLRTTPELLIAPLGDKGMEVTVTSKTQTFRLHERLETTPSFDRFSLALTRPAIGSS